MHRRQSSGPHVANRLSCVCAPEPLYQFKNPALVVGHPGHELRVFGWMSEYRPLAHVITDGSGRQGVSRVPSTYRLVERLGASVGTVFGAISDVETYRAILQTDTAFFIDIVSDLAASFVRHRIDFVAGDAAEGYNPTHDLCRAMVNAAASIAGRSTGTPVANYEFRLAEWEQEFSVAHGERCLHLRLNDDLLHQKLEAAEQYVEMQAETRRGIEQRGEDYFRVECLQRVQAISRSHPAAEKPFYERFGEERVTAGQYASVIRFNEHILPIMDALFDYAHTNLQARSHGT